MMFARSGADPALPVGGASMSEPQDAESESIRQLREDLLRQREAIQLRRVLAAHLPELGGGDVAPIPVEHVLGVGPGAVTMGIVDLHHDVVDADHMAQADRRWIVDGAEPEVAAQDIGGALVPAL